MTSPRFRQLLIVASSQLAALSVGGAVTFPTLLIESFRTDNSIQLDMDTKSWIGSIYGLAGILSIIMPMIAQKIGIKWGYITSCLCIMLGWILAYRATTAAEILLSESFHGLGTHSLLPVCFIGMTEMLPPKYRHIAMQASGIAQAVGMAGCGILGQYYHYKTISLILLVPIALAIVFAIMWLESPSWLAYRGQFNKCEEAFLKLRGVDEESKKELLELITAQKENLTKRKKTSVIVFFKKIANRDFYMPAIHIFVVLFTLYWGGVDAIYVYFIEVVKKSTNNVFYDDNVFYAGIIMYVIMLAGVSVTTLVIRKFNNKTVLSFSAGTSAVCLLLSSITRAAEKL